MALRLPGYPFPKITMEDLRCYAEMVEKMGNVGNFLTIFPGVKTTKMTVGFTQDWILRPNRPVDSPPDGAA